jgi:hypothetical protein
MKAVVLDAAFNETGAARILRDRFTGNQIEYTWFSLKKLKILSCRACGACAIHTPGKCPQKDDMSPVIRAIAGCDFLVFLTPIRYGHYSSLMERAVERIVPLGETTCLPDNGHSPLTHPAYLLAIGISAVNYNEADNFRIQVAYNARSLHAVGTALVFKPKDGIDAFTRDIDSALEKMMASAGCSVIGR